MSIAAPPVERTAGTLRTNWDVLVLLTRRELKVRYQSSFLGYLWTVLDPLAMSAVYWFVFTQVFGARKLGAQPYIVFLIFGMLPWNWFTNGVRSACSALTSDAKIIRSAKLPRELWVLKIDSAKLVEFVLAWPVLIFFMIIYKMPPSAFIFALPLALVLQYLLIAGIGFIVAPLCVLVKDVDRVVPIILRVFFYMSPVLYAVQRIPEQWRWVYTVNPLAGILELYRAIVFPGEFLGWRQIGISAAITLAIFFFGLWIFRRLEGAVLKEI